MRRRKSLSRWIPLGLALTAPILSGATFPDEFSDRLLATQNRARLAVGVGPLKWNNSLATDAQRWADHLAESGTFEHAPERKHDPQGENLWAGTRGSFSLEAMVDGWVREKQHFKAGIFPNNSTTGRVADVGHYTQLVWRRTGQVGCAKAASSQEDILVCRYSEAGNYIGDTPF